jgi:serine protease Do
LPKPNGALVSSVEKGSPADKAGIENGDVILKFDGKPVELSDDLPRLVGSTKAGTKATVQVMRNKTLHDLPIVVGEMMTDDEGGVTPQLRPHRSSDKPQTPNSISRLGISASDPTAEQRSQLKVTGGVLVEDVQGAAAHAGLQRGDIILAVNNQEVKSLEQFGQLLGQFKKDDIPALLVRRNDMTLYVPLRIEKDAG